MKWSVTTLLLLLLAFCACGSSNFETRIAKRVNSSCGASTTCLIRIKDLTDFQWDKMYVFKYNATLEQIKEALGVSLPEKSQFTRKIVFMKEGKVIYNEELPTNIEHVTTGEVVFDIPDNSVYKGYTIDAAVFHAEKKESDYGVYYELKQIIP
jgi:hypothetical protein